MPINHNEFSITALNKMSQIPVKFQNLHSTIKDAWLSPATASLDAIYLRLEWERYEFDRMCTNISILPEKSEDWYRQRRIALLWLQQCSAGSSVSPFWGEGIHNPNSLGYEVYHSQHEKEVLICEDAERVYQAWAKANPLLAEEEMKSFRMLVRKNVKEILSPDYDEANVE